MAEPAGAGPDWQNTPMILPRTPVLGEAFPHRATRICRMWCISCRITANRRQPCRKPAGFLHGNYVPTTRLYHCAVNFIFLRTDPCDNNGSVIFHWAAIWWRPRGCGACCDVSGLALHRAEHGRATQVSPHVHKAHCPDNARNGRQAGRGSGAVRRACFG